MLYRDILLNLATAGVGGVRHRGFTPPLGAPPQVAFMLRVL